MSQYWLKDPTYWSPVYIIFINYIFCVLERKWNLDYPLELNFKRILSFILSKYRLKQSILSERLTDKLSVFLTSVRLWNEFSNNSEWKINKTVTQFQKRATLIKTKIAFRGNNYSGVCLVNNSKRATLSVKISHPRSKMKKVVIGDTNRIQLWISLASKIWSLSSNLLMSVSPNAEFCYKYKDKIDMNL